MPGGWQLFFERVLHYVTPPLFVLDWLLFVPKGERRLEDRLRLALGFPPLYAVWTLVHGALTGWYPYPFLDVAELGYPQGAFEHRRAGRGLPRCSTSRSSGSAGGSGLPEAQRGTLS